MWHKLGPFGGHPALDFVNTVDDLGKSRAQEAIPTWDDVLAWAVMAGVVSSTEAKHLAALARDGGRRELRRLQAFREALWLYLRGYATGEAADAPAQAAVEAEIRRAVGRAHLNHGDGVPAFQIDGESAGLDIIRHRMALGVVDLLYRHPVEKLRECGRCTGLFLNLGRGVGRRWCRMETCGNRTKVERFRRR